MNFLALNKVFCPWLFDFVQNKNNFVQAEGIGIRQYLNASFPDSNIHSDSAVQSMTLARDNKKRQV